MQRMHTATPRNRLREIREQRGVELIDVAFACRVHPSTVSRWQVGLIPQEHQAAVAELLDVSVPYLTGWASVEAPYAAPEAAA